MYLQFIKTVALQFMRVSKKLFKVYKMESHKGNKNLLINAKIKNRSIDISLKFKPFKFKISKVEEYDSYKKITVISNDLQIILESKHDEKK